MAQHRPRKIPDKETVDEIIFKSGSNRDRLILELQARCGLRIGEVLNLNAADISGRKLVIEEPKSGKDAEVAFISCSSSTHFSPVGGVCCQSEIVPRRQGVSCLLQHRVESGKRT